MASNDGWEDVVPDNSSTAPKGFSWKIDPREQAKRDQEAARLIQNERDVEAGKPSRLIRTRDVIPGAPIPVVQKGKLVPVSAESPNQDAGWEDIPETAPQSKKGMNDLVNEYSDNPFWKNALQGIPAVAETGLAMASGLPGFITGTAGKLKTLGSAALQGRLPSEQELAQGAESFTPKAFHDYTYEPRTAGGKLLTEGVGQAFGAAGGVAASPGAFVNALIDKHIKGYSDEQVKQRYREIHDKLSPVLQTLFEAGMVAKLGQDGRSAVVDYKKQKAEEAAKANKPEEKPVQDPSQGYTQELPFGEQRLPTRAPYNILPEELRKQLEAELNPIAERPTTDPLMTQGRLFDETRPYEQGELIGGRKPEVEGGVSPRSRATPDDITMSANDWRAGDATNRQAAPYEMVGGKPDPIRQIPPEQLQLITEGIKKVGEKVAALEYQKTAPDIGAAAEARAAGLKEQAALTNEGIPYQGQPALEPTTSALRGPGRRQAGALFLNNMFKKKGIAPSLIEQRKAFEVETRTAKEVATEMMEKGTKDISENVRIASQFGIPKQVAILSEHPIIKWAVDRSQAIDRKIANAIKSTLEGDKYVMGRFGRERRIPGEEGGLTKFRRYYREGRQAKAEISEMKDIWIKNVGKAKLTAQSFRTARQWETYKAMQKQLDNVLDLVNKARQSTGLDKIPQLNNYFPAIWEGDYFVRLKDSAGETKQMASVNSRAEAKKLTEQFQKKFPQMKVEWNHREKSRYDIADVSVFEEAANALAKEGNTALAKEFGRIYADVVSHRGAGRHGIQRKFVEGFLGMEKGDLGLRNMERAYESYVTKLHRYVGNIEKANLKAELGEIPKEVRQSNPNALKYSSDFLDAARGKDLNGDAIGLAVEVVGKLAGRGAGMGHRGVQNLSAMLLPMWLLTFRMAISQLVQPTNNLAMLSKLNKTGEINVNPLKAMFDGYLQMAKPDAISIKANNWAAREGYLDPTISSLLEFKISETPTANTRALMEGLKLPLSKLEQHAVRQPSFFMYEKALRDTVKDDITRFRKAAEIMDQTMVNYGHGNVPLIYNRMGILGDASKSLKQYSHNAWGQFFDYAKMAKNEKELAPLAWHLGNQIAMGGLKGTVLVAEATAIIALLNTVFELDIPTPEKMMHEFEGLPDALVMGGLSTVLGYDVSSSVSHPGLPSMLSMPALEFGAQWADATSNFIIKYIKGEATDADKMKAWLANTPSFAHNWIENLYTDEGGFVPNPNDNMKGVYQRSPEEKLIGNITGLRSTQREGGDSYYLEGKILDHVTGKGERGEAQARSLASAAKRLLMLDAKQKISAINAIVDRVENGQEIEDGLMERYLEEGGDPKRLTRDIKQRIIDRTLSPTERPFKKGTMTPDKIHKLDRLKELGDIQLRVPEDSSIKGDGWEDVPTKSGMTRSSGKGMPVISQRESNYRMPIGKAGSRGTSDYEMTHDPDITAKHLKDKRGYFLGTSHI